LIRDMKKKHLILASTFGTGLVQSIF